MIKDLKPGRLVPSHVDEGSWVVHSYSHILTKKLFEEGYRIRVKTVFSGENIIIARITYKNKNIGSVRAYQFPGSRVGNMDYSEIFRAKHRGKGLGAAGYEAVFAHMYHKMGIRFVSGDKHSTSAARTHKKVAMKHGLDYPFKGLSMAGGGDFDGLYGKYKYPLE